MENQFLAVFAFKIIILLDVYTLTLKRRLNGPFDYLLKENCSILLKVNMVNHMLLVDYLLLL
jgi:hypothetical protein